MIMVDHQVNNIEQTVFLDLPLCKKPRSLTFSPEEVTVRSVIVVPQPGVQSFILDLGTLGLRTNALQNATLDDGNNSGALNPLANPP